MTSSGRRLLLVHAHPDDESITTGATMARYAGEGVQVTLLTCTLGEEGEILVPELAGLAADRADQLGGYRIGELAAAMQALGVADHRFLCGAGHFRDSGMMGSTANEHPRAFWRAATDPQVFAAAVAAVVDVIRDVRPHVVVSYDEFGGYGHPDHIMAHRVTTAALRSAADAPNATGHPWQVRKFYETITPRGQLEQSRAALVAADQPFRVPDLAEQDFVPDDRVTATVDARARVAAKSAALAAHRTQILIAPPFYALSNGLGREIDGIEHYRLVFGDAGVDGPESDLFAGVDDDLR